MRNCLCILGEEDAGLPANVVDSVILGIVQGVSEWIPISSKTQVTIVATYLFALPVAVAFAFGLFMEIGSLGSAAIYFRKSIYSLFHDRQLLVYLVVVTLVTAVVGVPLYIISEKVLENAYNLGAPLLILGSFLVFDGLYIRYSRRTPKIGGLGDMSTKHYVILGVAQGLAALPGVSRSGMTVSTMLFMGVDSKNAFTLSYLAYIPASIGAFLVTLVFSRAQVNSAVSAMDPTGVAISIVTAAAVGLVTISALLKVAKQNNVYVITLALGVITIAIGAIDLFY
jgi:undecaprenyl-diphosphatase